MGGSTADGLLEIYKDPGSDPETKQAVIQALFLQGNADALVQLARSESNPSMKASLVQRLSLMDSPAAKNYLIELLQQ
jgi:HEAT repeat protein